MITIRLHLGIPVLAWKLAGVILIAGAVSVGIVGLANAEPRWPTPPPAPPAPDPRIETDITPVPIPPIDGATRWVVQPIPQGSIPVIPPLASDTFEAPGHLKVTIEAGSLDRTIQLTYVPLPVDQAPLPERLQSVVKAFDLLAFDHRGRILHPALRRPWVLEVSIDTLGGAVSDPGRLIFARFEQGRWLPLVTYYFRHDNRLLVRVLKTGRFAVLAERPPN